MVKINNFKMVILSFEMRKQLNKRAIDPNHLDQF